MEYTKPLPKLAEDTIEFKFWEAAKKHELSLQHCQDCGTYILYPRSQCPQCWSTSLKWEQVRGHGEVYSFPVVHRAGIPGFEKDTPYVYAVVQLDEGARIATNIIGIEPDKVTIGMKVAAFFDDVTPEVTLVKFKPVSKA